MELKFAEYMLALERERNFTRAARSAGISQSAMSNFVLREEKQLGAELFVRCRNALLPTALGRMYIDAARQMLSIKAHAYQRIRAQCGKARRRIRIGVTPSRGLKHITGAYSEFVAKYPDVRLEIEEQYVLCLKEMLLRGEIDMFFGAITKEELETDGWTSYRSVKVRIIAAVHRNLAQDIRGEDRGKRFPVIKCSDLKDLPMILHGESTAIRAVLERLFMQETFAPAVIADGNNSQMVRSLIKSGLGVGFIPEHYMDDEDMGPAVTGFFLEPPLYIYRSIAVRRGYDMSIEEKFLADLMWEGEVSREIVGEG